MVHQLILVPKSLGNNQEALTQLPGFHHSALTNAKTGRHMLPQESSRISILDWAVQLIVAL